MSKSWVWDELEVEMTRDVAVIRRAYARRLKVVHPEDDSAGFMALRRAFEQAMDFAAHAPASPRPAVARSESDVESGSVFEIEPDGQPPSADDAPPNPLARLEALLDARAESDLLGAAFNEILNSPAMEHVGTATQVEIALIELIARTLPVSDPLVDLAIYHFGDRSEDANSATPAALARVLHRPSEWRLEQMLRRLEDLLQSPSPARKAVAEAIRGVVDCSALEDPAVFAQTAGWLSQVLEAGGPPCDALLAATVQRSEWRSGGVNLASLCAFYQSRPVTRFEWRKITARSWMMMAFALIMVLGALSRSCTSIHASPHHQYPYAPSTPRQVPTYVGWAQVDCDVVAGRRLTRCQIIDYPPGQGFGDRASAILGPTQAPPQIAVNSRVRIYVQFPADPRAMVRLDFTPVPSGAASPYYGPRHYTIERLEPRP